MDINEDIESKLLHKFNCLGTQDKDTLISEFRQLLAYDLSKEESIFFLDMNNWNLQAAVCSFLEYDQPIYINSPQMTFVGDITIGEGESISPNTRFIKTWRVQNSGKESWPYGCTLKFIRGVKLSSVERVSVDLIEPGNSCDLSVEMISPSEAGIYESQWRMVSSDGLYFGDCIWVILQVEECGVLGVVQQFSQLSPIFFQHTNKNCDLSLKLDSNFNQQLCDTTSTLSEAQPSNPFYNKDSSNNIYLNNVSLPLSPIDTNTNIEQNYSHFLNPTTINKMEENEAQQKQYGILPSMWFIDSLEEGNNVVCSSNSIPIHKDTALIENQYGSIFISNNKNVHSSFTKNKTIEHNNVINLVQNMPNNNLSSSFQDNLDNDEMS